MLHTAVTAIWNASAGEWLAGIGVVIVAALFVGGLLWVASRASNPSVRSSAVFLGVVIALAFVVGFLKR